MDKLYSLYELVKLKGYKLTEQRKVILKVIVESKDYILDPSEIFEKVLKIRKDVNFSTVYRNLDNFQKIGIIKRISSEGGKNYYRIVLEDDHVHSMICKECGRVETLKLCPFNEIDGGIFETKGFIPQSHKFEVYGICKYCVAKKREEKNGVLENNN